MATQDPLAFATASELSSMLDRGETSSVELTHYFLERIKANDEHINCVVTLCEEQALTSAEAADKRRKGDTYTALTGVPMLHKDIFCTRGVKTTCSSRMLENFVPPYDATVVQKLNDAGAITLGKTNMDEFAMGSSTETSHFGLTRNPWDTECVPGKLRWICRRRRRRIRTFGDGHRYRGVYSPAGRPVWHNGSEAHLWSSIAPRYCGVRLVLRPGRSHDANGRRRRVNAKCHGGP